MNAFEGNNHEDLGCRRNWRDQSSTEHGFISCRILCGGYDPFKSSGKLASGKTTLAQQIAKENHAVLISDDI